MTEKLRTWCEISLDALEHNIRRFREKINKETKILGVVKADAYGHGAYEVAEVLAKNGADFLAVAVIDEAIQLRKGGITLPILILGYTNESYIKDFLEYNITPTVYSYKFAKSMSDYAVSCGKVAKIHLKIDTGMSRIGLCYNDHVKQETVDEIKRIYSLPNIEVEGIFTHFAVADEEDTAHVTKQFGRFKELTDTLSNIGINIPIKHCCNSAAAMRFPEFHMDMVRIGISLYGLYPSGIKYDIDLRPAMTLKSTITHIKNVEIGETISYGATYTVSEPRKIATVAIGYADGYSRLLSNKAEMIVGGKIVPVVGRICMDQCMIDVTDVNNISVGDEAIIFGADNNAIIPIEDVASKMGTINYELLCILGMRVPRCYTKGGEVCYIHNYLLNF